MIEFLSGAVTLAYLMAAGFFLRFWRKTADRLFLAFTVAFVLFAVLWLAFAAGLIWTQGSINAAWEWVRTLPLLLQPVVWVLFLPVVAGLWVRQTTWPLAVRLVIVGGAGKLDAVHVPPRLLLAGR